MSAAQKGLLALIGLLVLLMFAGLLCGPADEEGTERGSAGSNEELAETRRDSGPRQPGSNPPRDDDGGPRHELVVYVSGPDGDPVVGARAALLPTAGDDRSTVASASTGSGGRARLENLPSGRFQLVVTAGGYMNSQPIEVRMPEEDGREIAVRLPRAARFEGSLFLLDGQPATHGLVRVRAASGGEQVFHLEPDERGSFRSGGLQSGVWEVSWVAAKDEPADSRVLYTRAVSEGDLVRLEVTLPDAVAEPTPGRRVGIVERD